VERTTASKLVTKFLSQSRILWGKWEDDYFTAVYNCQSLFVVRWSRPPAIAVVVVVASKVLLCTRKLSHSEPALLTTVDIILIINLMFRRLLWWICDNLVFVVELISEPHGHSNSLLSRPSRSIRYPPFIIPLLCLTSSMIRGLASHSNSMGLLSSGNHRPQMYSYTLRSLTTKCPVLYVP
jgi:hypothetical protein